MADTNNSSCAGAVSATLAENEYVKELFGILRENGRDTSGLAALINHVSEMESFVRTAEGRIAEMMTHLDTIKEVQGHPIKNTLQKTIKALEAKVADIKEQIVQLRLDIAGGCINAINAFKEKGAAALDKLASFFKIKGGLQSINKNIEASVKLDDKAMAKIEAFSKEYHESGRHLKNMGRVLVGKPPINVKKESGKLAKAIIAPYLANRTCLLAMMKAVNNIIGRLDRLEQKSAASHEKRAADRPADGATKKPSLTDKIKANRERIKQKELDKPTPERKRAPGLDV